MELNDEQQAVMSEQAELQIKINKLSKFIESLEYKLMDDAGEKLLLYSQQAYMDSYNRVLINRIAKFTRAKK